MLCQSREGRGGYSFRRIVIWKFSIMLRRVPAFFSARGGYSASRLDGMWMMLWTHQAPNSESSRASRRVGGVMKEPRLGHPSGRFGVALRQAKRGPRIRVRRTPTAADGPFSIVPFLLINIKTCLPYLHVTFNPWDYVAAGHLVELYYLSP